MLGDPTAIALEVDARLARMSGVATHGRTPFDVPFVSQITDTLWTGGCRDGLTLPTWIEHLVSLYPWEQYRQFHGPKSVLSVRMFDSLDQSTAQIRSLAEWVNACRADGPTLVHCQAGLNRSALVAATALVLDGMTPDDAVRLLREKRSPAVLCNAAFESWVRAL